MDAATIIKEARELSGLTLRELAARAGTSHGTLAAYEAGRVNPTYATLQRIIESAGLDLAVRLTKRVSDDAVDRSFSIEIGLEHLGSGSPGNKTPIEVLIEVVGALEAAGLEPVIGGSLSGCYCAHEIDLTSPLVVHLALESSAARAVVAALPKRLQRGVAPALQASSRASLVSVPVPIEIVLGASRRDRRRLARAKLLSLAGEHVRIQSCADAALDLALDGGAGARDRLTEMAKAGSFDVGLVIDELGEIVGGHDRRLEALVSLIGTSREG